MLFGTKGFVAPALVSCAFALVSTCFPQDVNAQYGSPYLVAAPQESVSAYGDSGQSFVPAPGQQLQPYGFLWTGYNATVEYDIYGLRRMQQQSPLPLGGMLGATRCLGDENNPCGNPDCSNCKSRSRSFFNGVINTFTRSGNCTQRCNGDCCNNNCSKCQQRSSEGQSSNAVSDAAPTPITDKDVVRISPSVPVPVPMNDMSNWPRARTLPENELPKVEHRPPSRPSTTEIPTNIAPNPAIDQIDPMPDPPEPTLHVPTHIEPRLPRNRLPEIDSSNIDSQDEDQPRSSRRPQRTRTLEAVGQYIKS